MNLFDVRKLLPRARRRISPREEVKGVVGCVRGQSLTQAASQKKAQRRVNRKAMTKAIVDGLRENPAGSKLLRRFAKNAGLLVQESDGKKDWLRKPTYVECRAWYGALDEAQRKQGHQTFRRLGKVHTDDIDALRRDAVRVMA